MPRITIEPQPDPKDLPFCGRVFLYCESRISHEDHEALLSYAQETGISLVIRGPEYAEARAAKETPQAFISHDSRDKDTIARLLAVELSMRMCPVWFDEYSLRIGSSLRESIERGLKECKRCVLIVSKHFLSNSGFTKAEFNSIFTREIIQNRNYILPVWAGVSAAEVYEYSSSLANKVAINWDIGVREVARKLAMEISSEDTTSDGYRTVPVVLRANTSDE